MKLQAEALRAFPAKTYKGRERVSRVPRWVTMWIITLAALYYGVSVFSGLFNSSPLGNPLFGMVSTSTPQMGVADIASTIVAKTAIATQNSVDFSSSSLEGSVRRQAAQQQVYSVQPTYAPQPTYTPYPTAILMPSLGEVWAVGYSYYWPPFGPPNCSEDNWHPEINICDDVTASGLQWSRWVGRAIAVPVQWRQSIPLLSRVYIYGDLEVQGEYLVIDYCGDCIKDEGHIYVDFLDNRQRLAWTVPLLMVLVSVP